MRIEETKLYSFDELSDEAKERAIEKAREDPDRGMDWADEWRGTIERAEQFLPIEVKNWEVGLCSPTYCDVEFVEEYGYYRDAENLEGARAWKWLHNNDVASLIEMDCPFTGFCADEAFLAPLRTFLKRPDNRTLGELFQECASAWAWGWESEMEYQHSDKYIIDEIRACEREFTEDGSEW